MPVATFAATGVPLQTRALMLERTTRLTSQASTRSMLAPRLRRRSSIRS